MTYRVIDIPLNTMDSNQVKLDRDWLNIGDVIYYNNCPIKISHKGTSYRNGTWYQLDGVLTFTVGDTFTDAPEKQINEEIIDRNIHITININFCSN